MRKRASVVGLGLRMTVVPVCAVILAASLLQVWLFLRTDYIWVNPEHAWSAYSFEYILDEQMVGNVGKLSFLGIMCVLVLRCSQQKGKFSYTLRRLRIRENEITAIWLLVFSGYFLISWAVQLGLVLWMFTQYATAADWGKIDLFVASYRSAYFHTLLPLSEPWGWWRNAMLCLSWGTMGALICRYMRHGGKPFMALMLVGASVVAMPSDVATKVNDIISIILLVGVVIVQIVLTLEVERNED